MLTAEGKRKQIRMLTIHDLLYKIIRMLQRTIYIQLKPATHLAILDADRGEFDRQRKSQAIFAID